MSKKYLYYFSEGSQAFGGDKTAMRNILGGKGSGLAEMTAAGMPVPQGFTITTEACTQYYADGRQINAEIQADIFVHVRGLEELTGKKLGGCPPDRVAALQPAIRDYDCAAYLSDFTYLTQPYAGVCETLAELNPVASRTPF